MSEITVKKAIQSDKNILVIDTFLMFGLPISQRLAHDGYNVVYSTVWGSQSSSPYVDFLGKGGSFKLDPNGWMNWLNWADCVVVTDSVDRGNIAEFIQKRNIPIVAPNKSACKLELDRDFGWHMAEAAGINVPWQKQFTDLDELAIFIKKNPKRYVLKVDQTVRDVAETLVGLDPEGKDIIGQIERLDIALDFARGKIAFYLQEFLEGTEVAIGGIFNGQKIVNDQLFVSYDGIGGFCYDLRIDGGVFIDKKKLEFILKSIKHIGFFDINGILTEDGKFNYLEWTPRWGSGMTEFFCHSVNDMGALFCSVANGEDTLIIKPEIDNKIVVLVNSRNEDPEHEEVLDIILPEGESMSVIREDVSFWSDTAGQTSEGDWVIYPIQADEHRKARYVAHGDSIEEAIEKIDKFSSEVKVTECLVDTARAKADLEERVNKVFEFVNK